MQVIRTDLVRIHYKDAITIEKHVMKSENLKEIALIRHNFVEGDPYNFDPLVDGRLICITMIGTFLSPYSVDVFLMGY